MKFFDQYNEFSNKNDLKRLQNRLKIIFDNNKQLFHNNRILDLGSHDGRWSAASLYYGAKNVLGIEGRKLLVNKANALFKKYNFDSNSYSFINGNFNNIIPELHKSNLTYDIILCLGVFYHINNHVELFQQLCKFKPKYILLDTEINNIKTGPSIQYKLEHTKHQLNSTEPLTKNFAWVGCPNNLFIYKVASLFEFKVKELKWNLNDWNCCDDYKVGDRKTYLLTHI